MTTLPNYTPYYGGGQVANPANVLQLLEAPSDAVLSENRLGTIGILNSSGAIYMLSSKSGGLDTWKLLSTSGGAGSFTTLTNTLAYTLGTAQAANNSTIGSGQTSGTIVIGGSAATGAITLGSSSGTQIVNVGTGSGANAVNICSGGSGIVSIGNATGNTSVTGSLTASTSLTATLGNITATNGNLSLSTIGNHLEIAGGTLGFVGSGNLTNGVLVVNNTNIAAGDLIYTNRISATGSGSSTALGVLTYTIIAGTSITFTSLEPGTPANTQTGDQSSFSYLIIRPL